MSRLLMAGLAGHRASRYASRLTAVAGVWLLAGLAVPAAFAATRARHHAHPAPSSARTVVLPVLPAPVTLSYGTGMSAPRGSALVRALQRRLAELGDAPGPVDGRYGPLTRAAVERFQSGHGLVVDGIAGPVTLAALEHPTPVLMLGAGYPRGDAPSVRRLQRRLAIVGVDPGPIDGLYGPSTEYAVRRFQAGARLVVDGIAGPQTMSALVMLAGRGRTAARAGERTAARAGERNAPGTLSASRRRESSDGARRRRASFRSSAVRSGLHSRLTATHRQAPASNRPSHSGISSSDT